MLYPLSYEGGAGRNVGGNLRGPLPEARRDLGARFRGLRVGDQAIDGLQRSDPGRGTPKPPPLLRRLRRRAGRRVAGPAPVAVDRQAVYGRARRSAG